MKIGNIRTISKMFILLFTLMLLPCLVQAEQEEKEIENNLDAILVPCPVESPVTCNEGPGTILLKYGDHVDCVIDPVTDIDQFKFIGSTGESIRIIVRSAWPLDARLEVWDPDGDKIVNSFCYDDCTIVEDLSLTKTGKYLVAISDEVFDQTGNYQLKLEKILPIDDALECISYNTASVNCDIDPVTDMDFFTFMGADKTDIRIIVRSAWPLDARLEVWDPDGNKIVNSFCYDDCTIVEDLSLTKTGKYLVAISDEVFDQTGNYSINIVCIQGKCRDCPNPCKGTIVNDQMWTQAFGGGFSVKFSPGDGLVIKNAITIDDEGSGKKYGLRTIYRLKDSSNTTFKLGDKFRKRGKGHHIFTFNSATIPNSAALGKAEVTSNTQLKCNGEIIGRHSKTVPIYIK